MSVTRSTNIVNIVENTGVYGYQHNNMYISNAVIQVQNDPEKCADITTLLNSMIFNHARRDTLIIDSALFNEYAGSNLGIGSIKELYLNIEYTPDTRRH